MKKIVLIYVLLLHILLALIAVKTDILQQLAQKIGLTSSHSELGTYYYQLLSFHIRVNNNVLPKSVLFIGDSITQGLAVSAVYPQAVNFGIGGDTTTGVLQRLPYYSAIKQAKAVVLAIGVNDLRWRDNQSIIHHFDQIIAQIPNTVPIIISAILPVDENIPSKVGMNTRIQQINTILSQRYQDKQQINFINITPQLINSHNNLHTYYHIGDGIHLSPLGYKVWIKALQQSIHKLEVPMAKKIGANDFIQEKKNGK